MSYSGDKRDQHCKTCRKKQTWVKCSNCNGRGATYTTTCKYKCTGGYKCATAPNDPYHPVSDAR